MSERIVIETEGAIRKIRIDRPDKKNALTVAMYGALAEAIADAGDNSQIKAIFLTGTEDSFTSGNDLNAFLQNPPSGHDSPVFRFLRGISSARKPIVAAVNGLAVGIGTRMLLHCELVYAAESARFHLPFVNLALVPEAASSLLLPRLAGYQRAAELMLLGEPFGPQKALSVGIVTDIFPDRELQQKALGRAADLAAKAPAALRATKALLKGADMPVEDRMVEEAVVFGRQLQSPEARETMQAFLEKRPPDYSKFD
ncbi:MAG: enoyl-CoA hydratase [Pseudomonadota bacterium]